MKFAAAKSGIVVPARNIVRPNPDDLRRQWKVTPSPWRDEKRFRDYDCERRNHERPRRARLAVSYNAGNIIGTTSGTSNTSFNVGIVGSPTQLAIVVGVAINGSSHTISGVTIGGTAAAALANTSQTFGGTIQLWWLYLGSASGNKAIVATWTGSSESIVGAAAFDGTDSTTPFVNGVSKEDFQPSTYSQAVTSVVGDMAFWHWNATNAANLLTSPTQTEPYSPANAASAMTGGSQYAAGAASVTAQYSIGASASWVLLAGCSVKAGVAAATFKNW